MKKIKSNIIKIGILLAIFSSGGCDDEGFLDKALELRYSYDDIINYPARLNGYGMDAYKYLRTWTQMGSNALLASACDEADFANKTATVQRFNTGGWNQFSNPDEVMDFYYRGIVQTIEFLKNSEDFRNLMVNDTFTVTTKTEYLRDCDELFKLRAENHFLRAWFYFELIKRYGGVPILTETIDVNATDMPARNTFDECVDYILDELDVAYPDIVDTWYNYDIPDGPNSVIGSGRGNVAGSTDLNKLGRLEKVAVKAFRLRVLLYAASPLWNTTNDISKWEAAAAAGHDFLTDPALAPWRYLWTNYAQLFDGTNQNLLTSKYGTNSGIIFTIPGPYNTNNWETWNYPVSIPNGGTSVTSPSQNLVDAFEVKVDATTSVPFDWSNPIHAANPFNPAGTLGRDPRLNAIVGINGTAYGKDVGGAIHIIQSYAGGNDGPGVRKGATTTGYYLKKFCNTTYDLSTNPVSIKAYPVMRYAEVLLNYAEAMNEAYGADAKPTINGTPAVYSAMEAVNLVRNRTGVAMPAIPLGLTQAQMREKISNERRVELAFEEHRCVDVRRWKIAETTESADLMGINIIPDAIPPTSYTYSPFVVESRAFDPAKMYLHPIPESQVLINGWGQNPGW